MYKSNRVKAKEFIDKIIKELGVRELDFNKVIATIILDVEVSPSVAREMLDTFIIAGKFVRIGNNLTLSESELIRQEEERAIIADEIIKEHTLNG